MRGNWLNPQIQNGRYKGTTDMEADYKVICKFSIAWGVGAPNPHFVQRSTVFKFGEDLNIGIPLRYCRFSSRPLK